LSFFEKAAENRMAHFGEGSVDHLVRQLPVGSDCLRRKCPHVRAFVLFFLGVTWQDCTVSLRYGRV
jgi:hypothetical protein